MSLAQRFERRLEGLVGGAFARVFKGQVEPVEIGSALQREATDRKNIMGSGQVLCPNRYRVTLAACDYDRLEPWEAQLTNALAELVQEHLDENQWTTIGDIEVYLARDDQLHTGVFGVASRMESDAPPRRRPHDSLSMPVLPGQAPGRLPAATAIAAAATATPSAAAAAASAPATAHPAALPAAATPERALRARPSSSTPRTSASNCATAATSSGAARTPTCSCSTRASRAATSTSSTTAGTPPSTTSARRTGRR